MTHETSAADAPAHRVDPITAAPFSASAARGRRGGPARAVKRTLDVVLSALGLVLLGPLMLAIALAIRGTMGSPILFRQRRPGRFGQSFAVIKFRTMNEAADANGRPLSDAVRVTRVGRILRRLSLDELPELWNVLKGEMSLVGPRPLLLEYLGRYTPEEARRHETRPGITGWAQVNGRRRIQMHDRLALDVWYVDNWSLALDLRILAMTLQKVVRGEGVEPPPGAMDPFQLDLPSDLDHPTDGVR